MLILNGLSPYVCMYRLYTSAQQGETPTVTLKGEIRLLYISSVVPMKINCWSQVV